MTKNTGFGLDEAYITSAMAAWEIPGLSIAIVKDGLTVYSKGFGNLSANGTQLVDEHTLFTIGSCTKAFTATALAMLVMDGKCSWDDLVRKYLPNFKLEDESVAAKLTLRDLASHQSGVEDGAITNIPASTLDEALANLASLKAMRAQRAGFSYNNTMFAVLGQVVEKVSGMSWENFLQSRILSPLGMTDSRATVAAASLVPNHALAHNKPKGARSPKVMPVKSLDFLASSAALQSSASDMAAWLKFQLAATGSPPILSKPLLDEMHSEQLQVVPNPFTLMMHPGSTRHGYGLAWFNRDYAGTTIVQHGGYVDGFTSFVAMGPEYGFGVVVLTNMHNSLAPFAVAYRVIDAYLGVKETDWSSYFLQKRNEHRNKSNPHPEKKTIAAMRVTPLTAAPPTKSTRKRRTSKKNKAK